MLRVTFHSRQEIAENEIRFAVIAARYGNHWIFCRHHLRQTWEIPGGHREPGETPVETAKRELYEETGALEADIRPVCVYNVQRDGASSFGLLCYAEVSALGEIPADSEIAEIQLEDSLPQNLTYPLIQPYLFDRVQGWLNVQSSAGEIWDVYDARRRLTGRTHRRGDPLSPGDYHLVVHIWIQNSRGEFLLTKRSPNKGYANLWESTGGSALSGDDSLAAALREVREETGILLDAVKGTLIHQYSGVDYHTDVWLFRQEFHLDEVILQEGETCDKMSASTDVIHALWEAGNLVPYSYFQDVILRY